MLELNHRGTYYGACLWADEPVVTAEVLVTDTAAFTAAATTLTRLSADWFTPPAQYPDEHSLAAAAFIARWTRDMLNHQGGRLIEAGAHATDGRAILHVGYYAPEASRQALALCVRLLTDASLDGNSLAAHLRDYRQKHIAVQPDFQAAYLIEYARRKNLPWGLVEGWGFQLWFYGSGSRRTVMFQSRRMTDSFTGTQWAWNKGFAKRVFRDLGTPIAASMLVGNDADIQRTADFVGFPCVAKPLDAGRSIGVTTHIRSVEDLRTAFQLAAQKSPSGRVVVEHQVEGELIRIMVADGEFRWAVRRNRPKVVGDGHSTVAELRAAYTRSCYKPGTTDLSGGPAPADEQFFAALREQGLHADDIPEAGRSVRLRNIPLAAKADPNVIDWAFDDVTDILHPDTRDMAVDLTRYFGIQVCGLDFITEDPAQSCHRQGAFIEINTTPGLRTPMIVGVPADDVCKMALGPEIGRVPILLVVASPDSTDEIRRLIPGDRYLGWAVGGMSGIGSTRLSGLSQALPLAAAITLRHPRTRAVVLIATPAEIERHGLPCDWADHAVVLNNTGLDDDWKSVVRRRSGAYQETTDLAEVNKAIAALGRAQP